jgi:predicted cobalt transporter CbtA
MTSQGSQLSPSAVFRKPWGDRPDHFSTYAPRDLVRQLKVIAAVRDVPLWAVVTEAMREYLVKYEQAHGPLPGLVQKSVQE